MKTAKILAIHHLNCCTNQPPIGWLYDGQSPCRVITHTLLVETDRGLILVDTGIGTDDMKSLERLGFIHILNRPRLDVSETALKQIEKLGFQADDVHHIIITHLDFDHTGGLSDFPNAVVHVLKPELEAAMKPGGIKEKHRYRKLHWAHSPKWASYEENYGEPWFGFDSIRDLKELPPEIALVRLPGHKRGHCGGAIRQQTGGCFMPGMPIIRTNRWKRAQRRL